MGKKLSELSIEELWQLFPIFLKPHLDDWLEWYEEEKKHLRELLGDSVTCYHIGSTAIQHIWAKPIIDIIIAAENFQALEQIAEILKKEGYLLMSKGANRISLNKGYTEDGFAERVFHIHLRLKTDIDEIYFRDYLNQYSDIAKEYEKLKLQLWKEYEFNRDAYTEAKTEFVLHYTRLAKEQLKKGEER